MLFTKNRFSLTIICFLKDFYHCYLLFARSLYCAMLSINDATTDHNGRAAIQSKYVIKLSAGHPAKVIKLFRSRFIISSQRTNEISIKCIKYVKIRMTKMQFKYFPMDLRTFHNSCTAIT